MLVSLERGLLYAMLAAVAASGVAHAEPRQAAPITYAAAPVQTASLTGGDERSYGYGGERASRSAPIDLRQRRQGAAEEGAPAWLERERVGPPYEINGRWYTPTPEPGYAMEGTASWYGPTFHGQATASGEIFDQEALTAAHPTLPIPSLVQVTNLENGREIIVRVNDRGPFVGERLIDLSRRSAEVLGFEQAGQARVHVRYLGPAPRQVRAGAAPAAAPPIAAAAPPRAAAPMTVSEGPVSLLPPETPLSAPLPPVRAEAAPPAAATGNYFVQVGAFADLMNAHRVQAAIQAAGPVVIDARETAQGELFRVRIGPWLSREEAEAARAHLAQLGYAQTIVASR